MSDEIDVVVVEEGDQFDGGQIVNDPDELDEIMRMLEEEYKLAEMQIAELKPKWDKWRRQRLAKPEQEKKNWPWPNASNASVPVTRIITQTLFGMLKSALMRRDPTWTVTANRDVSEDKKIARFLTRYLDLLANSPNDLNLKTESNSTLLDGALVGFNWVKVPWTTEERSVMVEGDMGTPEKVNMVVHDGPEFVSCEPEDILFNRAWKRLEDIPVFFYDVHLPWHVVNRRGAQGIYENVDELEHWVRDHVNERDQARAERLGYVLGAIEVWDITECYFYWDVDGDGIEEYVKFTVHIDSGTVLRQEYNSLGMIPFVPANMIFEPYNIEGTGTGLACEHMQDEADAIHNMRNDNMKIANQKIFVARKSGSIKPNETFYPGKILFADDPQKDFNAVQMGEVYPSSLQSENYTIMYAQKATGVSDVMGGFADQTMKTRDSGVAQSLRLQQGTGLFSTIMENMVESFSKIGQLVFFQLVLHRDQVLANEAEIGRLTMDELELLQEALDIPLGEINRRLTFSVHTTDVEQTFEVKRQNMLTLSQLYMQYGQQMAPLAGQLFGPQGQQMMQQSPDLYQFLLSIYTGGTKLLANVFNFFGEDDDEAYLPDIRKAEMLQDFIRQFNDSLVELRNIGPMNGGMNANGNANQGGGARAGIESGPAGMEGTPGGPEAG